MLRDKERGNLRCTTDARNEEWIQDPRIWKRLKIWIWQQGTTYSFFLYWALRSQNSSPSTHFCSIMTIWARTLNTAGLQPTAFLLQADGAKWKWVSAGTCPGRKIEGRMMFETRHWGSQPDVPSTKLQAQREIGERREGEARLVLYLKWELRVSN